MSSDSAPRPLPFQERKSPWRGWRDLLTGCYPAFLFGGPFPSDALPVFHFHEAAPDALEPYFRHLAENHYVTLTSDEITALVLHGIRPPRRGVALTFDDAWNSLRWTVLPLLQKYDLRAIAYVSPARITDFPATPRPLPPPGTPPPADIDRRPPFFCTWSELREVQASGRIDLQAHSLRHAQIEADSAIVDFLAPGARIHPHDLPWVQTPAGDRFLTRADLGAPLRSTRSRLSPAFAWKAPDAFAACTERVRQDGPDAFFRRPDWRTLLRDVLQKAPPGRWETPEERTAALREELGQSREILESRLHKTVTHMCFPWAVSSPDSIAAARFAGFETACSDRLGGRHLVEAGNPPYQLMRLKHAWLPCLPGTGRRAFFHRRPSASTGLDLRPPLYPLPNP